MRGSLAQRSQRACASSRLPGTIVRDSFFFLFFPPVGVEVGLMSRRGAANSKEVDWISEERGVRCHTQMHDYPTRKGTGYPAKIDHPRQSRLSNVVQSAEKMGVDILSIDGFECVLELLHHAFGDHLIDCL